MQRLTHNCTQKSLEQATATIEKGGVVAYPTEGVWGLGADPFNERAVRKLLSIKQRPFEKGLILIAADWAQISPLIQPLSAAQKKAVLASWPGPITWVFPASDLVPAWIHGAHPSVALRITTHPIAHALCKAAGKPIVSTSANLPGKAPALTQQAAYQTFKDQIDYYLPGPVGSITGPTEIRDVLTNSVIRSA